MRHIGRSVTGITRVPNQVAHELVSNGLWDGSKIQWNSQGGIKRMLGNPLKDMGMFSSSPVDWYEKYVLPMYAKMKLSPADMNREDALIGGRTGGLMFSVIRRQQAAMSKSVESQRAAYGIDKAYGAAGGTLNGKIIDMQAKFTNLLERLGEAVLPLAIKGLTALIPAITAVTSWIAANPGKVRMFAQASIILGAALVGFGTVAIAVAAFAAVVAGGTVAIVVAAVGAVLGAVGAFVLMNWKAISDFFTNIAKSIGGFINFILHGDGKKKSLGDVLNDPNTYRHNLEKPLPTWDPFGLEKPKNKPAVPPPSAHKSPASFTMTVDGRVLGQVTAQNMARSANTPASGFNGFDGSMHMPIVGLGAA